MSVDYTKCFLVKQIMYFLILAYAFIWPTWLCVTDCISAISGPDSKYPENVLGAYSWASFTTEYTEYHRYAIGYA